MDPRKLAIADYTYELPPQQIAKYPLEERDQSKLLVYKSGKIMTGVYRDIAGFLPKHCLLVFNDTRVVEARLLFQKLSGGVIEIFCLEPGDEYHDISSAMVQKGKVRWNCLVGGASKWKHGMTLQKRVSSDNGEIVLEAAIAGRLHDSFVIEFNWHPADLSFAEILHLAGFIPLPPYLHRPVEEDDKTRYQTIYARNDGSVAAPTAGLHFTPAIFEDLRAKKIQQEFVTLHVGAGTFKPVKAERIEEHEMHSEFMDVSAETIRHLLAHAEAHAASAIVAVGTTSLRTMESLYWLGVKVIRTPEIQPEDLVVGQWEAYDGTNNITTAHALGSLLQWMTAREMKRLITKTQILIAPGYELKVARGIITNFHQPQSTLLLLIAAIVGTEWKTIYEYALSHDFRFLSYGDGCLLWQVPLPALDT